MGIFDSDKKRRDEETLRLARAIVAEANRAKRSSGTATKAQKQVVWQCRYCGVQYTRWQQNGMPPPGTCIKNGKMHGPKGPHRWIKIMTK